MTALQPFRRNRDPQHNDSKCRFGSSDEAEPKGPATAAGVSLLVSIICHHFLKSRLRHGVAESRMHSTYGVHISEM
jgi:hypothetical protein